jgi:hypothetical protein
MTPAAVRRSMFETFGVDLFFEAVFFAEVFFAGDFTGAFFAGAFLTDFLIAFLVATVFLLISLSSSQDRRTLIRARNKHKMQLSLGQKYT